VILWKLALLHIQITVTFQRIQIDILHFNNVYSKPHFLFWATKSTKVSLKGLLETLGVDCLNCTMPWVILYLVYSMFAWLLTSWISSLFILVCLMFFASTLDHSFTVMLLDAKHLAFILHLRIDPVRTHLKSPCNIVVDLCFSLRG